MFSHHFDQTSAYRLYFIFLINFHQRQNRLNGKYFHSHYGRIAKTAVSCWLIFRLLSLMQFTQSPTEYEKIKDFYIFEIQHQFICTKKCWKIKRVCHKNRNTIDQWCQKNKIIDVLKLIQTKQSTMIISIWQKIRNQKENCFGAHTIT